MTSTIGVKKIIYPNGTNIATLDSSGSVAFAGASTVGGTLGVTGASTFNGNMELSATSPVLTLTATNTNQGSILFKEGSTQKFNVSVVGSSDVFQIYNYNTSSQSMVIDASGRVTKPSQVAFMAQPTSTQSNLAVAGSGVNIDLGTERFDVGGDFASNTFTAPVTGKYALHALFYMNAVDSGTTYYEFTIKTSNRNYGLVVYVGAGGSTDHAYATWSSSVIADMDASDTAYLHFYQAGGTQQTDVSTGTYFMGYLLG